MKIACSSASFAESIAAGGLTQLEWLDVCANELEIDGVVLAHAQFPRTDDEYLAQLKKTATDLGLTIAAYADDGAIDRAEAAAAVAVALGAPLVVAPARTGADDIAARGRFIADLKIDARVFKRANVTLALRPVATTLCASGADFKAIARDVDSAWVRVAYDTSLLGGDDGTASALLAKAPIAMRPLDATGPLAPLARFRGFVVLERDRSNDRVAFHRDVARFKRERLRELERDDDRTAVCMLG